MLFQVLRDKKVLFHTTHEKCVPSAEEQKDLKKAGYTIKVTYDEDEKKGNEV